MQHGNTNSKQNNTLEVKLTEEMSCALLRAFEEAEIPETDADVLALEKRLDEQLLELANKHGSEAPSSASETSKNQLVSERLLEKFNIPRHKTLLLLGSFATVAAACLIVIIGNPKMERAMVVKGPAAMSQSSTTCSIEFLGAKVETDESNQLVVPPGSVELVAECQKSGYLSIIVAENVIVKNLALIQKEGVWHVSLKIQADQLLKGRHVRSVLTRDSVVDEAQFPVDTDSNVLWSSYTPVRSLN